MNKKIQTLSEKKLIELNEKIKAKVKLKLKEKDFKEIFGLCEDAGFIKGISSVLFYGADAPLERIERIKNSVI